MSEEGLWMKCLIKTMQYTVSWMLRNIYGQKIGLTDKTWSSLIHSKLLTIMEVQEVMEVNFEP